MTAVICVAALTCAAMIVCVLTGAEIKKLHIPLYLVVTVIGAAVVLAAGLLPLSYAVDALVADTSVNPIKILVLFLSITMLSAPPLTASAIFLSSKPRFNSIKILYIKNTKRQNDFKPSFVRRYTNLLMANFI